MIGKCVGGFVGDNFVKLVVIPSLEIYFCYENIIDSNFPILNIELCLILEYKLPIMLVTF